MINQSFIFLDGVSAKTEQKIWSQSIHSWQDFIYKPRVDGISKERKYFYNLKLHKAIKNLQVDNIDYFNAQLPSTETWRLFDHFKDDAVYLDIETTSYHGDISMVGLYDGDQVMQFVKGKNLYKENLQEALDKYRMIVTFNGASFDLPVIRKYFNPEMNQVHIDLRHVCTRLDLTGGLKKIEQKMGLSREEEVQGISGGDAALLWRMYANGGNEKYLKLLLHYNKEDIVNLEPLAKMTIKQLWDRTREKAYKATLNPMDIGG